VPGRNGELPSPEEYESPSTTYLALPWRWPLRAVSWACCRSFSNEKYPVAFGARPPAKSTSAESGNLLAVTKDVPGPS